MADFIENNVATVGIEVIARSEPGRILRTEQVLFDQYETRISCDDGKDYAPEELISVSQIMDSTSDITFTKASHEVFKTQDSSLSNEEDEYRVCHEDAPIAQTIPFAQSLIPVCDKVHPIAKELEILFKRYSASIMELPEGRHIMRALCKLDGMLEDLQLESSTKK